MICDSVSELKWKKLLEVVGEFGRVWSCVGYRSPVVVLSMCSMSVAGMGTRVMVLPRISNGVNAGAPASRQ